MLYGKFWITPHGTIDVTTSEHNLYAKNHLLGLTAAEQFKLQDTFAVLSSTEVSRLKAKGVSQAILDCLSSPPGDLRPYCIRTLGWIRTVKAAWYIHRLDDEFLSRIRSASGYWSEQRDASSEEQVELIEIERPPFTSRWVQLADLRNGKIPARHWLSS